MGLYFSSEISSHVFKAQSSLLLLSAVCLCSEMTVSGKQIGFCVEQAILANYTHPDKILSYVSIVSEGPPKLKQSCDDLE